MITHIFTNILSIHIIYFDGDTDRVPRQGGREDKRGKNLSL